MLQQAQNGFGDLTLKQEVVVHMVLTLSLPALLILSP